MNLIFCLENLKGRDHFCRPRRIWKGSVKMDLSSGCRLDASGSGSGAVVVPFEHGTEPLGCIKGGEFLN